MNNNNTTYHPLGDYIRKIDKRNRDLALTKPMGINIDKQFMPSVANVIGTDMSNYKLVGKNQFACNLMHVGRDGKIPVAINTTEKEILVSPAYHVFEIVDKNALSPDFLMMWFHREEFDREASFYTDADVRSGMDFKALMEMRIPVPPISEQRAIVADYEAVARRIAVAKRTIATLQATAQTLYRKMFVDGIDKENLPEGWRWGTLGDFIESASKQHKFDKDELIFLNTSDILNGRILHHNYSRVDGMPGQAKKSIKEGDILFSEIRPANKRFSLVRENADDFVVSTKLMVLRMISNIISNLRIYFYLTMMPTLEELQQEADGASGTFPQITFDGNLRKRPILIGNKQTELEWENFLQIYYDNLWNFTEEIEKLTEIQTIILSGMGR